MKRVFLILFASMVCVLLASCSNVTNANSTENVADEKITPNIEEVEDVTVEVTDKTVTPKNIDQFIYSNYANFEFLITNNTEEDIKGIQGELNIKDLFGVDIITVGCDFTGRTIAAGSSITVDDLSLECNEFIDSNVKLYNEDYEDLQFTYIIKQIVFEDGTVKEP